MSWLNYFMAPFRHSTKKPEPTTEQFGLINAEEFQPNTITAEGGGGPKPGALQENAALQHESNDRIKRRTARKAKSKALQRMIDYHLFCSYCSDHEGPDGDHQSAYHRVRRRKDGQKRAQHRKLRRRNIR